MEITSTSTERHGGRPKVQNTQGKQKAGICFSPSEPEPGRMADRALQTKLPTAADQACGCIDLLINVLSRRSSTAADGQSLKVFCLLVFKSFPLFHFGLNQVTLAFYRSIVFLPKMHFEHTSHLHKTTKPSWSTATATDRDFSMFFWVTLYPS